MKLQNESFKNSTEAGGAVNLTHDDKIWVPTGSINKTLDDAIVDGDIGGPDYVPNAPVPPFMDLSTLPLRTNYIIDHTAADFTVYLLPTPIAGTRFTFIHNSLGDLRIVPAASHSIKYNKHITTGNAYVGYLVVRRRGIQVSLVALNSTTWIVDRIVARPHRKDITIGQEKDVALMGRNIWIAKNYATFDKYNTASFDLNGYGYVTTGQTSSLSSTTDQYNTTTDSWVSRAIFPFAYYLGRGTQLNGSGYVYSGNLSGPTNINHVYNDATNLWTSRGTLVTSRHYAIAFMLNGYAYVANGLNGPALASTERYNDNLNTWTTVASSTVARGGFSGFNLNGYGYATGGWDGSSTFYSTVDQYNDTANTWLNKAPITSYINRLYPTGFINNQYGYIVNGGLGGATLEQYDDALNTWTTKASSLYGAMEATGFTITGYSYIVGGEISGFGRVSYVQQYN